MKYICILLFLFTCIIAPAVPQTSGKLDLDNKTKPKTSAGFRIQGNIKGLKDGSVISVIDGGARKTIVSTVASNGQFTLTGTLDDAAHVYLYENKSNKLADILLDNRSVTVSGTEPIYDKITISGSEIDLQWRVWSAADQRIGYQRYRIRQVHESLIKNGDTENAAKLQPVIDELTKDRIVLLKSYVRQYSNSPAGAMLPNLCTLQHNLTPANYSEMFHLLSPRMQKTKMGQEVLKYASAPEK